MEVDSGPPAAASGAGVSTEDKQAQRPAEIKDLEANLKAIKALESAWAAEHKIGLMAKLEKLRLEVHDAKVLHAPAHVLDNRVRAQQIKTTLQAKLAEAEEMVDKAKVA
ncbi:unnamed protein product [Prorocentrum cordatum]|uniref:Uncharacterized protein n=1 Tax=Prorocentrum cordatum TaxID=2364126 RepID=A0ABN9VAC8_9DINO|nr:unnamed protein product [Polarella glacialis]